MSIEHKTLLDPEVHEPKGVTTAADGTVYVADGLGSGDWEAAKLAGQVGASVEEVPVSDGAGGVTWDFAYRLRDGWRDMIMPFTAATAPALNAPGFIKVRDDGAGSTGVYGYGFDDSAEENLFITFHIDHDFKVGSAFYPHIHWAPLSSGVGVVRWGIEWTFAPRTATPSALPVTTYTYLEQAGCGTPYAHQVIEVADPGITLPGCEPDTLIMARVFRDATHANDTYVGDAVGLFLDAHYQVDRFATPNKAPDFYS